MTRFSTIHAALMVGALLGGCRYDIDGLFEGELLDSGPPAEPVPDQLIELWKDKPFSLYSDTCAACAASQCGDVNTACKNDPECVAFTRCVAQSTDPVTQTQCRADHVEWLSENIFPRDVGGPYSQCVLQDRCTEQCGSRDNFTCIGKYAWPTTNDQTIPFRFRFTEAFTLETVAGMQVKVCRADDLYCASPIETVMTDEKGEVDVQLLTSLRTFQGYFELTKETGDPKTSIYPTLLRLGWPITREGVTNITVINSESVSFNIYLAGVQPDPERGLLQVRFYSCSFLSAPGVSFTTTLSDEASRYWYADKDGIPNFNETRTYTIGAAGVINVPEGRDTITATIQPDPAMPPIKVGETAAPVRKGYMSIVLVPAMGSN